MKDVHKNIFGYATPIMPNMKDSNEKFWRKLAIFTLATVLLVNVADLIVDIYEIRQHQKNINQEKENSKKS